jgi:hypothetical protein
MTVQIQTHGYGEALVSFRKFSKAPKMHVMEELACLKHANQIRFKNTGSAPLNVTVRCFRVTTAGTGKQ